MHQLEGIPRRRALGQSDQLIRGRLAHSRVPAQEHLIGVGEAALGFGHGVHDPPRSCRQRDRPLGTHQVSAAAPAVDAGPADAAAPVGCGGSPVQVRVLALTYPASTGAQLPVDVYLPPGGGAGTTRLRPMLVMVHGGGWFFGDRHEFDTVARDAAMHGYIAVNIEYDMTPPRWPKEPDDVKAAIAWARSQAAQWGGDPTKMATWGASAGANPAVDAAAAGDHSGLQAAVGWSGPYDLAALPAQVDVLAADCQRVASIADPAIYLGCLAIICPATYTAVSPALTATLATPPMYLANSQAEIVPLAQQEERPPP